MPATVVQLDGPSRVSSLGDALRPLHSRSLDGFVGVVVETIDKRTVPDGLEDVYWLLRHSVLYGDVQKGGPGQLQGDDRGSVGGRAGRRARMAGAGGHPDETCRNESRRAWARQWRPFCAVCLEFSETWENGGCGHPGGIGGLGRGLGVVVVGVLGGLFGGEKERRDSRAALCHGCRNKGRAGRQG